MTEKMKVPKKKRSGHPLKQEPRLDVKILSRVYKDVAVQFRWVAELLFWSAVCQEGHRDRQGGAGLQEDGQE